MSDELAPLRCRHPLPSRRDSQALGYEPIAPDHPSTITDGEHDLADGEALRSGLRRSDYARTLGAGGLYHRDLVGNRDPLAQVNSNFGAFTAAAPARLLQLAIRASF